MKLLYTDICIGMIGLFSFDNNLDSADKNNLHDVFCEIIARVARNIDKEINK